MRSKNSKRKILSRDAAELLLWSTLGGLIVGATCVGWLFPKLAVFDVGLSTLFFIALGTSFFVGLILASQEIEYNKILLSVLIMVFIAVLIVVIVYGAPMIAGLGEASAGYTLLLIQRLAVEIVIIVPSGLLGSILGAAFAE